MFSNVCGTSRRYSAASFVVRNLDRRDFGKVPLLRSSAMVRRMREVVDSRESRTAEAQNNTR